MQFKKKYFFVGLMRSRVFGADAGLFMRIITDYSIVFIIMLLHCSISPDLNFFGQPL
jgi:hypothetical protein